ncbi:MAG: hypothetical protein K2M34_02345 [Alphaproteobacteria bacterium]|nr:hypothetical protein [Alphaproteobacteria bacterium]
MYDFQNLDEVLTNRMKMTRAGGANGPVVTRHYYKTTPGACLSRLRSVASRCGLWVDWCRGENSDQIAVDVPHEPRDKVSLSDVINSHAFKNATGRLPIAVGVDTLGDPIISDLADMQHILIAGDSGTGKTTLLKSIAAGVIARNTPDTCKFMVLSPTDDGIIGDANAAYLSCSPFCGANAATTGLCAVGIEMFRRYNILQAAGASDIDAYNGGNMPRLVVIIDDLAELMAISYSKASRFILQLTQKARPVGIHIVASTIRVDGKSIPGNIKANFPTRISFHTSDASKSRQVLDMAGAELLLPYGDAFFSDAHRIPQRIHTPYVDV